MPSTIPASAPVKIAIVGCGAVTTSFHLPVLAGHDGFRIAALVDNDLSRAQRLAAEYRIPAALSSIDQVTPSIADAALLATPAFLHATQSIALLEVGLHVLVEKPMALTSADAERMVSVARISGRVLTVGLFRRLLPAIRLFRAIIDSDQIGDIVRVDAEVGDAYTWHLTTMAGMRREQSGGGALADMGPHVVDLVLYLCNAQPTLLRYADNAGDGIETDCEMDLLLHRGRITIPGRIELSRTRKLRNTIRVEGTRDTIEWNFGERSRVLLHSQRPLTDTLTGARREAAIEARWRDEVEQFGFEGFRAQMDDWLGAIRGNAPAELSAASVLATVRLVEECYAKRTAFREPWFEAALPPPASRAPSIRPRRVLITGASGFIGCRLSERLHFGSDWQVRAFVRSPGRAVRLARMPDVEFAIGDLTSETDLARALEGTDAVVHAGIGTSWRPSERINVNVNGTRKLVDAAVRAGVKRFVHISTLSVYGDQVTGTITEDTPVNPKKGWDYGESKLAAERIVLEAAAKGLPAVVLRVAVVYGPYNMTITARPLEQLMRDQLFLADCANVPSNTVYVDNVCHGIALALDAPDAANGHVFILSDEDGCTWGDYFGYFASEAGRSVRHITRDEARTMSSRPVTPTVAARWWRSTRDLVLSSEMKQLAKRIYQSDPWGTAPRWFIESYPQVIERLAARIRPSDPFVYRPRPTVGVAASPFIVDPIHAGASTEKIRRVLGYSPAVAREQAMALTLEWARAARIVPEAVPERVLTAVSS